MALAVDPQDGTSIDKWLSGGSARRVAMAVATKGAHTGVEDFVAAVKAARLARGDLTKLAQ